MNMNTWDLSGALVRIGDNASMYAKKANMSRHYNFSDLVDFYNNILMGFEMAVKCFKGFKLQYSSNLHGYYTRLWITYNGDMVGLPWVIGEVY